MLARSVCLIVIAALALMRAEAQATPTTTPSAPRIHYGKNPAAGHTYTHDGIKLYYEVYGAGEPLLLIHGNGSSIGEMSAQIAFFRKHYMVIAMDSRGQGKSGDPAGRLTYEEMTDDLDALLGHLHARPAYVLGWSDGGIESLLLAERHPARVKMIASMAANLYPEGAHPEAIALIKNMADSMPTTERETPQGMRDQKLITLMLTEPHIDPKSLESITAPVLVLASDHDMILDDHTLEIYHHLSNSQLCIFPNATHMVPFDDPALFNATVYRFFRTPFVKKDRIKDLMNSFEALKKSAQ